MVSNIFYFHPYLGKITILTSIFFRWVGSTTNQKMVNHQTARDPRSQMEPLRSMVMTTSGSSCSRNPKESPWDLMYIYKTDVNHWNFMVYDTNEPVQPFFNQQYLIGKITIYKVSSNQWRWEENHMGRGTPKSSILIGFAIVNHTFWGTPIFGNTHIQRQCSQLPNDHFLYQGRWDLWSKPQFWSCAGLVVLWQLVRLSC